MKKISLLTILIVFVLGIGFTQDQQVIDSLKSELAHTKIEDQKIDILISLCEKYWSINSDSSLKYGQQALSLAQQTGDSKSEAIALQRVGGVYQNLGDYPKSFQLIFWGLEIATDKQYSEQKINCLASIGVNYVELKDYTKAISYYKQALAISYAIHDVSWITHLDAFIGSAYGNNNRTDSAFFYMQKAFKGDDTLKNAFLERSLFREMGVIQFKMGEYVNAFQNVHKNILINQKANDHRSLAVAFNHLADFFKTLGNADSGIYYARQGLYEAQANGFKREILRSAKLLAELYEPKDLKQALYYHKLASLITDELFGAKKTNDLQKTLAEEQERQRQAEVKRIAYENQLKQYAYLAGLIALLLIAFLLYRNNLREKKAKNLLREKNEVIENAYRELKSTQSQLIQSEKMASLGELTAGIAHEIQNPLNFVNNFSEVNKELLTEMKDEMEKGNLEDAKAIANDVIDNEDKINHHGKRADAIVKGMLQHSQISSGQKEPTDINKLADEYLRLAYNGIRAKDKSFKAILKTDYDETIGSINIIPQDIGRVLLNLYGNAFYAVTEKKKQQDLGYEPTVTVQIKKLGSKIEISVKDNGNGIPQKILDKIFQPFFTTKPTGQGTGLGLSLAYDIIKAHGGEIKVETKEGEGAEFIILLPL